PHSGEGVAAEQVPLGVVVHSVAIGPDEILTGTAVDLDTVRVGLDLPTGRIGPEEVAVDTVAGCAGPRDVDARALEKAPNGQAADGAPGAGAHQAVAAAGLRPVQLDQGCTGIARLRGPVDQQRLGDRR